MPQITTRTVGLLYNRAGELDAIAEALHEAGYREAAESLTSAANLTAKVAAHVKGCIDAYVSETLAD